MSAWRGTLLLGLLLALTAAAGDAVRAAPPGPAAEPLTWEALLPVAGAIFEAGPGRAGAVEAEGLSRAARVVPGRLLALDASGGADARLGGGSGHGVEASLAAALVLQLGRAPELGRRAWSARAEAATARQELARWEFVSQVADAWVAWWAAKAVSEQLHEHRQQLDGYLAPLRQAARSQAVSRVLVSDLEAELARVDAQAAVARREAASEAAGLQALLGRPVTLPETAQAEVGRALAEDDPWRAVLAGLEAHPALRSLDREAEAARAEADALGAATAPTLSVGVTGREEGDEGTWGGLMVGLSVPLADPNAPEVARLRSEAMAAEAERRWRGQALRAEARAASQRFEALAEQHRELGRLLLEPLERRVALFEEALASGQVSLDQVIRARRDLQDALQARVATRAELMRHAARGRATAALMASTAPTDGSER